MPDSSLLRPVLHDVGLLVLRVGVGLLMMGHGVPKLMKGPAMWEGLGGAAMGHLGITFTPTLWGFLAASGEGIGGLLLALGLATRPASVWLASTMAMAFLHHYLSGDGWSHTNQSAKLVFVFVAIALTGPGRFALDGWLSRRWRRDE